MNDSLYLAALAVAAMDNLDVVGTRPPFTKTADYLTGGVLDGQGRTWIVRCPLNSTAATTIETEAALAPFLLDALRSGNLPFDIIRPAAFTLVEEGRAVVYPAPFGSPTSWEELTVEDGREIGRMVASIHMLSTDLIDNAGMPVYRCDEWRRRLITELDDVDAVSPIPPALKRRWLEALEDPENWNFTPTVIHGDIDAENFLWSDNRISTISGFGEAKVADPAVDLAPFLSLDEEVYAALIDSYENTMGTQIDDATFTRTLLMSELAITRWLMHGIRTGNEEITNEARDMLEDLLQQLSADPELGGPSWNVDPEGE